MVKKAMRTSNGKPVFVSDDGSYVEEFPVSDIVRRSSGDNSDYLVYGFVGDNKDYEEKQWNFKNEKAAIDFATLIYGRDDVNGFNKEGEVFEVEVHEV